MSKMKWSDGITTDSSGPLRILKLCDGYYVIGEGLLMAVDSREEGLEFIKEMKKNG